MQSYGATAKGTHRCRRQSTRFFRKTPECCKPVQSLVEISLGKPRRQQAKCLHSVVLHRGDSKRAQLAVRLRDVHTPKRLRFIAPPPQIVDCRRLLFSNVTHDAIHLRSSLTQSFPPLVERPLLCRSVMCGQMLQRFHFAPSAHSRCLRDTLLKSTYFAGCLTQLIARHSTALPKTAPTVLAAVICFAS